MSQLGTSSLYLHTSLIPPVDRANCVKEALAKLPPPLGSVDSSAKLKLVFEFEMGSMVKTDLEEVFGINLYSAENAAYAKRNTERTLLSHSLDFVLMFDSLFFLKRLSCERYMEQTHVLPKDASLLVDT